MVNFYLNHQELRVLIRSENGIFVRSQTYKSDTTLRQRCSANPTALFSESHLCVALCWIVEVLPEVSRVQPHHGCLYIKGTENMQGVGEETPLIGRWLFKCLPFPCIDQSHTSQSHRYPIEMTVWKKRTMALQWPNLRAPAHTPVNNMAIIQNALETLPKHDNIRRKWKSMNMAKDNRMQNVKWPH